LETRFFALAAFTVSMAALIIFSQTTASAQLSYETPTFVTTVRTNSSYTVGYYGLGQISCNSDESLTGGGYYSSEWHELLSVYRNGPSDDGKTWFVEMMYVAPHYYGTAPSFTIYAMCSKVLP
jgi:hypothetical protein